MLSNQEFIRKSLELNLVFLRLMKEHAIFIEGGLTPKSQVLAVQAERFKNELTSLLHETVNLSYGRISLEVAASGEIVTRFTLNAEKMTEFYTGMRIDTTVTMREMELRNEQPMNLVNMVAGVENLNSRVMHTVRQFADFKAEILQNVLACKLFTHNYPTMIEHLRREALYYLDMLERLQNRSAIDLAKNTAVKETFWNHIMEEHAKFIRGMLDPEEENLIEVAQMFAGEFEQLTTQAENAQKNPALVPGVTRESREATGEFRNFKAQGTQGMLACQIKSVMLPLLGDHVLREANYYLRLLKVIEKKKLP